jgi:hypothetical protein
MAVAQRSVKLSNLSGPELIEQFGELNSQCAAILITLGTPQESKKLVRRLRQQAVRLGRQLQCIGRANLKHPTSKDPTDPNVPNTLTPDDFVQEIRRCIWDCLAQFTDTHAMEPHERLALLRRRFWMRGRRLELISKACVVERAELLRISAAAGG